MEVDSFRLVVLPVLQVRVSEELSDTLFFLECFEWPLRCAFPELPFGVIGLSTPCGDIGDDATRLLILLLTFLSRFLGENDRLRVLLARSLISCLAL